MVQLVKALTLLQLWCRLQLWLDLIPGPRNFHMLWVWPKNKKAAKGPVELIKNCVYADEHNLGGCVFILGNKNKLYYRCRHKNYREFPWWLSGLRT